MSIANLVPDALIPADFFPLAETEVRKGGREEKALPPRGMVLASSSPETQVLIMKTTPCQKNLADGDPITQNERFKTRTVPNRKNDAFLNE